MRTFQIQVFGAHGGLRGDFGVDLDRVQVVSVAGYVHVVPVVVVQRTVGVAFDQVRSVAQVGDVVQVAGERPGGGEDGEEKQGEVAWEGGGNENKNETAN